MLKILQINYTDLLGGRFNGRALNKYLQRCGHDVSQCVWTKQGSDKETWVFGRSVWLGGYVGGRLINLFLKFLERIFSIQSLLYPWGLQLFFDERFTKSDVVHYHLLHNHYFSLLSLPRLVRSKASVWTIHDPWVMTGHCVYPQDCERWHGGCGECPDLETFMPMRNDNTRKMFRIKKNILATSDVDIVVASHFMFEMAKKSPVLKNHRIHHIPFGVDLSVFKRVDAKSLRKKYNIDQNGLVISFRETDYEYKGLRYIKEVLRRINVDEYRAPIVLMTVNQKGLLDEFKDKFQIIELGMVADEVVMAELYSCSDVFLMPSTAEAFGMMAIEAMACGVPVIAFEGTSLPEILYAPIGGVCVPMHDANALYTAVDRLLKHPEEREIIGDEAYRLSRIHYDFGDHAKKILELYEEVVARRKSHDKQ